MNEAQFSIKIKEYRPISDADIDINGITVISGDNGCGKSSISLLAFEYFNSSINIDKLLENKIFQLFIEPFHLLEQFIDNLKKHNPNIKVDEVKQNISTFYKVWSSNSIPISEIKYEIYNIISIIRDLYDNNEDTINENIILEKEIARITRLISDFLPEALNNNSFPPVYLRSSNFHNVLDNLQKFIIFELEEIDTFDTNYAASIITDKIKDLYNNDNPARYIRIDEYGVPLYTYPDNKETIKVQSIKDVFYIDSPLILEASDDTLLTKRHWKHLRDVLKKSSDNKSINEIDNLFQKNIQIQNIEHQITFEERFNYVRSDGKVFNLSESATGIKAFAIINLLYKKDLLTKKTLLILDEPEVHLHPKWVVEYARLVVLLNKHLGVKFLIASHHPEFVSSIKYIAKKENIENKLNFYLAREREENQYEFAPNGYEIDKTFESFNNAYDLIEKYGDNEV